MNPTPSMPAVRTLPSAPSLEVSAKLAEPGMVEFTVKTNLPTPLAAMASLELQGQKEDSAAIGTSHKVTLTGPTTTFRLRVVDDDNGMDGKALPKGRYNAGVIVGPKWDENKTIASLPELLEVKQTIELRSGR